MWSSSVVFVLFVVATAQSVQPECLNGGELIHFEEGTICVCRVPFFGQLCEYSMDEEREIPSRPRQQPHELPHEAHRQLSHDSSRDWSIISLFGLACVLFVFASVIFIVSVFGYLAATRQKLIEVFVIPVDEQKEFGCPPPPYHLCSPPKSTSFLKDMP